MDVNREMLSDGFDINAKIERETAEIMHLEPSLNLLLDLATQAHISTDKEIIDVQNNCSNKYAMILKREAKMCYIDM